MRQSVTITGLKEPMFAKAIDELTSIQNLFVRRVNKDDLELWQPPNYNNLPSVEFSNRYFTHLSEDPHASTIPLGHNVDPSGKLTALAGREFFHGEDNVVQYQAKSKESTKYIFMLIKAMTHILNRLPHDRLKSIAPCRIQIGDIVEVLMSILFILIRNHKFKMAIKLRGILILDTTYMDVSICERYSAIPQILNHVNFKDAYTRRTKIITPPKSRGLKRKLDYEDDEDDDNRVEEHRMDTQ
jgi:hypothetical protein